MLNKSHPLSRYTTGGDKIKNKLMHFHFDLLLGSLPLATEHKIQLCDNYSSELFSCLTPFSKG